MCLCVNFECLYLCASSLSSYFCVLNVCVYIYEHVFMCTYFCAFRYECICFSRVHVSIMLFINVFRFMCIYLCVSFDVHEVF